MDWVAGSFLGFLIGVVSGTVALVLFRTANYRFSADLRSVAAITSEILSIPVFWFGGPWLTTSLLSNIDRDIMINPYIIVLSLTFAAIVAYPIVKWIIKIGDEIGRAQI